MFISAGSNSCLFFSMAWYLWVDLNTATDLGHGQKQPNFAEVYLWHEHNLKSISSSCQPAIYCCTPFLNPFFCWVIWSWQLVSSIYSESVQHCSDVFLEDTWHSAGWLIARRLRALWSNANFSGDLCCAMQECIRSSCVDNIFPANTRVPWAVSVVRTVRWFAALSIQRGKCKKVTTHPLIWPK